MDLETGVSVKWAEISAPSQSLLDHWQSLLDDEECQTAGRLRVPTDAHAYLAAHALLRTMLAEAGGLPAADWRFGRSPFGKPFALNDEMLCFSLSHARGLVACAVARDCALGIDVEEAGRPRVQTTIAEHFFAPGEIAMLAAAPEKLRGDYATQLWTLREAFGKATGQGLRQPPESICFTLDPVTIQMPAGEPSKAGNWHFFQDRPTPSFCLALAARLAPGHRLQTVCRPISQDAI